MNVVNLVGNLGADAELKVFGDGNSVLNFSLATSERWKDKQTGEKKEKTEWHRCKMFGKGAAAVAEYMKKGTKVAVTGSIAYGSYEKDGVKVYTTDIKANQVELLGGKNGPPAAHDDDGLPPPSSVGEDEIPF